MSLFQDILSNLQRKFSEGAERTDELAQIISSTLGITVAAEQVTIKKSIAYIQLPPTAKLALSIKGELILTECKRRGIPVIALR